MHDNVLKLENQICFPLYACAKEVIKKSKPFLDEIGLTYTQYITMMVLWEEKKINVKTLGEFLYLDSGTLTPLLKKLEIAGYLTRNRYDDDERKLIISITPQGESLKVMAKTIPPRLAHCLCLETDELITLYGLLYKILKSV
jgi:DNA-binding MarR family transcriptional regulator